MSDVEKLIFGLTVFAAIVIVVVALTVEIMVGEVQNHCKDLGTAQIGNEYYMCEYVGKVGEPF